MYIAILITAAIVAGFVIGLILGASILKVRAERKIRRILIPHFTPEKKQRWGQHWEPCHIWPQNKWKLKHS